MSDPSAGAGARASQCKEIAGPTVEHYMTAILGKLEVGSRVEAALLAYKAGIHPAESGQAGD